MRLRQDSWASGQLLARYILDHPQGVRGKKFVDFGCGSGVVAIAAALADSKVRHFQQQVLNRCS